MNFFDTKVIEIIKETSDTYSYKMEIPEGYSWAAGQHCLFKLVDYKVAEDDRPTRVFTIASAPEDGFVMFTTRIADKHTSYKEILLSQLKVGDSMQIADAKGSFNFNGEAGKSLVIAGGIGITPIRSLLKHYEDGSLKNQITLFYSDDRGEFAYALFWKEITAKLPNLDLHLIADRDEFMAKVDSYAKGNLNTSEYLIAGSPGMNKAFTEKLEGFGVKSDKIVTDVFVGY